MGPRSTDGASFDLDASAIAVGADSKVLSDKHFVYFNNLTTPDGTIQHIQGGEINQQAASSTVDVAKLQAAFDNVFATMDALDTFRAQATDSMAQTVTALQGQIERAKPYVGRTRQGEISG